MNTSRLAAITACAFSSLMMSSVGAAQSPSDFKQLAVRHPGVLHVQTDEGESIGRIVAVSDLEVVMSTAAGSETVAVGHIREIWTIERATAKGAIAGLLVGSVVAGYSVFAADCRDCAGTQARAFAIEAGSAILGGWLGHRRYRRVVLYEAAKQTDVRPVIHRPAFDR